MGLLEEHKAERRARILKAARRLIAERGYHGLTMRALARAARVSVPTLYNLFGGKDAILAAELDAAFSAATRGFETAGASFLDRAFAVFDASSRQLGQVPDFYRELTHLFLTSPELRPLRRRIEERYIRHMAENLERGRADGELAAWIDPEALARSIFGQYMSAFLLFAGGELSFAEFRTAALWGISLQLLGLARGAAAERLEQVVKGLQPSVPKPNDKEVPDVATPRS